ncbi:MAG: TonB-dependent receptor [Bacteroidetes bacterium]|nr:TonB-dependent receptor [Bacteroidota bacterium]MBL6943604.1 TonB-dependent receptor [Bacteroidales bacterium]
MKIKSTVYISVVAFVILLLSGLPGIINAQTAVIEGNVHGDKRQAVELANVAIVGEKGGTTTDENGYFSLKIPANKDVTLAITYIGFADSRLKLNLKPGETKVIKIELKPISTELPGFEVKDEQLRTQSMVRLNPKNAIVAPSLTEGVSDLIKTLPGVSSSNEMSSQYSVRGGNFDENLVYVNDIEIYRPFLVNSGQQEGLSFVNSSLVSSILFSAGGFGVQYGDKMSSVLDVKYLTPTEFGGSFSASLLGADLNFGGLAANNKLTYLVGARYKINSYLLNSLQTQGEYQPEFMDIQSLITYKLSEKWNLSFLGYYSHNKYKVVPSNRETDFGTFQEVIRFKVYFDGNETDRYDMYQGGLTLNYKPAKNTELKLILSAFNTNESETYDIQGQYWIGQVENNPGSEEYGNAVQSQGVGTYLLHARNYFKANVITAEHKGVIIKDKSSLKWGLRYQFQTVDDKLHEWEMVDSAGYSLPNQPDTPGNPFPDNPNLELKDFVSATNTLNTNRVSAYLSNQWNFVTKRKNEITLAGGIRANYWDFNSEFLLAPRVNFSYKPAKNPNLVFRFATGIYFQTPFYREMRDIDGTINHNVKAQKSTHFIAGTDLRFRSWNRPFIFTTEVYYKMLDNLIPYYVDNVRIRYLTNHLAKGYTTGIDFKIYGEFVKGIDSWMSLSIMQSQEDIYGDYYYDYFNADGDKIIPGITADSQVADSTKVEPGFIPRPTDQRVNFSIFFQDYIPNHPYLKMHLRLLFSTGLPFGAPDTERYTHILRMPDYRRVDIGFSYQFINEGTTFASGNPLKQFKNMWVSLEVFNLLQIYNTVSYIWIKDISNTQYAVPNYLTPRLLNIKLIAEF